MPTNFGCDIISFTFFFVALLLYLSLYYLAQWFTLVLILLSRRQFILMAKLGSIMAVFTVFILLVVSILVFVLNSIR